MTRQEMILEIISEKFNGSKFCWKCGGQLYWFEQIDGPNNLRVVHCNNPIHEGEDSQP